MSSIQLFLVERKLIFGPMIKKPVVIYFLFWYRMELDGFKIVDAAETIPLEEESRTVGNHPIARHQTRPSETSLMGAAGLHSSNSAVP